MSKNVLDPFVQGFIHQKSASSFFIDLALESLGEVCSSFSLFTQHNTKYTGLLFEII